MINLNVTIEEAKVIGAALSELPFKIAAPLLAKLQGQISDQTKPKVEEKAE